MSIKSRQLIPSKENLLNTLQDDLLDRNKDVWYFAQICNEIDDSYSIALDARWGQGKTFFIRHVKMLIEAYNDFTTALSEDEKHIIKSVFSKYMSNKDLDAQVCIYYDAWENDNDNDPILSLVYSILQETAQHYKFKKTQTE